MRGPPADKKKEKRDNFLLKSLWGRPREAEGRGSVRASCRQEGGRASELLNQNSRESGRTRAKKRPNAKRLLPPRPKTASASVCPPAGSETASLASASRRNCQTQRNDAALKEEEALTVCDASIAAGGQRRNGGWRGAHSRESTSKWQASKKAEDASARRSLEVTSD